jgi:rhodanese-related sulfurtransferase
MSYFRREPMKLKNWIALVAAALAVSESMTFAYQRVDLPRIKPQTKVEQVDQVGFITPEELKTKIEKNETIAILDLRGSTVYAQSDSKIKGAVHAKVRRAVYRLRALPRDTEVITYCACPADEAAAIGAQQLLAGGFKRVRVLKGGWNGWLQAGGQVQPKLRSL